MIIEHTDSGLKVHALHYANELLVREKWRVLVIDKSTYHENHISIYFLPQYQRQRKCFFFQSASWKRHCVTHWRDSAQRGMDSYLPRQISQSDCEISSNCDKKCFGTPWMNSPSHTIRILTVVKRTSYPAIKNSGIIFSAKVIWNLPRKFERFELSLVRNTQRVYQFNISVRFFKSQIFPRGVLPYTDYGFSDESKAD